MKPGLGEQGLARRVSALAIHWILLGWRWMRSRPALIAAPGRSKSDGSSKDTGALQNRGYSRLETSQSSGISGSNDNPQASSSRQNPWQEMW
jgi:hypothetical protein